jgi:hypothetical protein
MLLIGQRLAPCFLKGVLVLMKRVRSALLLASVLVLTSAPALAEPSSRRVRLACTGDAQRLCPKQKAGSEEMRYCMEAKARSLSSGCVRALEDDGIVPRGYLKR